MWKRAGQRGLSGHTYLCPCLSEVDGACQFLGNSKAAPSPASGPISGPKDQSLCPPTCSFAHPPAWVGGQPHHLIHFMMRRRGWELARNAPTPWHANSQQQLLMVMGVENDESPPPCLHGTLGEWVQLLQPPGAPPELGAWYNGTTRSSQRPGL